MPPLQPGGLGVGTCMKVNLLHSHCRFASRFASLATRPSIRCGLCDSSEVRGCVCVDDDVQVCVCGCVDAGLRILIGRSLVPSSAAGVVSGRVLGHREPCPIQLHKGRAVSLFWGWPLGPPLWGGGQGSTPDVDGRPAGQLEARSSCQGSRTTQQECAFPPPGSWCQAPASEARA